MIHHNYTNIMIFKHYLLNKSLYSLILKSRHTNRTPHPHPPTFIIDYCDRDHNQSVFMIHLTEVDESGLIVILYPEASY